MHVGAAAGASAAAREFSAFFSELFASFSACSTCASNAAMRSAFLRNFVVGMERFAHSRLSSFTFSDAKLALLAILNGNREEDFQVEYLIGP